MGQLSRGNLVRGGSTQFGYSSEQCHCIAYKAPAWTLSESRGAQAIRRSVGQGHPRALCTWGFSKMGLTRLMALPHAARSTIGICMLCGFARGRPCESRSPATRALDMVRRCGSCNPPLLSFILSARSIRSVDQLPVVGHTALWAVCCCDRMTQGSIVDSATATRDCALSERLDDLHCFHSSMDAKGKRTLACINGLDGLEKGSIAPTARPIKSAIMA
ncbi:hypothetical protein LIA77_08589 [Sarocladium implicatum]|nr:hypothetical protein LIA77_08589 [Sarocladium implicatum]